MTSPAISTDERRRRLAVRHHLAPPHRASDIPSIAGHQVGLHATDPATVYLSIWARHRGVTQDEIASVIYETRDVVRMLGMRRTMFVVSRADAPLLQHGCAAPLVARERKRLASMLEDQGVAGDGEAWLRRVSAATLHALEQRGEAVARELTKDVPELAEKLHFGGNATWAGEMGVSTRVLFLLAASGDIVRGRPRGSWLSGQYRWSTTAAWLGSPLPDINPSEARSALIEKWLTTYGPGSFTDLKWWTGWTVRHTREALADVGAVEVELDGGSTAYVLERDLGPTPEVVRWAALLPALDPTPMGWKERDWFLGGHGEQLFDRNGNIGPTVWIDGRIVGGWGQAPSGAITIAYLEDVATESKRRVDVEVDRLREWLDDTVVTPRFRTPVEKLLRTE